MLLFEGNQDVRVGRADETGRAMHEIDGAVWQSDVIENTLHFLLLTLTISGSVVAGGPTCRAPGETTEPTSGARVTPCVRATLPG